MCHALCVSLQSKLNLFNSRRRIGPYVYPITLLGCGQTRPSGRLVGASCSVGWWVVIWEPRLRTIWCRAMSSDASHHGTLGHARTTTHTDTQVRIWYDVKPGRQYVPDVPLHILKHKAYNAAARGWGEQDDDDSELHVRTVAPRLTHEHTPQNLSRFVSWLVSEPLPLVGRLLCLQAVKRRMVAHSC